MEMAPHFLKAAKRPGGHWGTAPQPAELWLMSSLQDIERFLVERLRQFTQERGAAFGLSQQFGLRFGSDGIEALIAFQSLISLLVRNGRRRFMVGEFALPYLTRDERQMLSLLAAVQGEDAPCAKAHMSWLAPKSVHHQIETVAIHVGNVLSCHGQRLQLPRSEIVCLPGNDPCIMSI